MVRPPGKSSNPLCDIEDVGTEACPGDLTLRDTAGADDLDGRPQRTDKRWSGGHGGACGSISWPWRGRLWGGQPQI